MPRPIPTHFEGSSHQKLLDLSKQMNSSPRSPVKPAGPPTFKTHAIANHPSGHTLDEKMGLLRMAYDEANRDPLIRQINANYGEKLKKVAYLNSLGESYIEDRVYLVFNVIVTAEKGGILQTAYESMGGLIGFELFDGDSVRTMAAIVRDRALKKLEAPQAPAGEMPVIIASSAGGTLIHEAIGHSLEADAVLEGTSPAFAGKIGKTIANEKLSIFDNPTVPNKRGSFYFDDEGTPSEATKLVDRGVLKSYLYDRTTAVKGECASNGHGRRESYKHRPIPRMSNTYVAPGPDDPKTILDSFQNGLLVTKMGGGQVNTANGDFVFEVEEGFQVKDGRKTLVRGATLLGNGPEVLLNIDQVGTDHGWAIGTCGKEGQGVPVSDALPTVHIKKLVVGGW